jgi:hypothetical protein
VTSPRRAALVILVTVHVVVGAPLGRQGRSLVHGQTLQKPAERSDYQATPSQEGIRSILRTLSGRRLEMRQELLAVHGLKAVPLRRGVGLDVEPIEVTDPVYSGAPYQGLTRASTGVSQNVANIAGAPGDL